MPRRAIPRACRDTGQLVDAVNALDTTSLVLALRAAHESSMAVLDELQAVCDRLCSARPAEPAAIQKGYSSTYLAMGFANVRAGTRVLMLVLVLLRPQRREDHAHHAADEAAAARAPQAPAARMLNTGGP